MSAAAGAGRPHGGARPRDSRAEEREARRRRLELKREFGVVRLSYRDPRRAEHLDQILDDYNALPKEANDQ